MSLAGCQIIPIHLNFHHKKHLEIFDKNSGDKIQSKDYKGGGGVNLPYLMPIRVAAQKSCVGPNSQIVVYYWKKYK